MSEKYVYDLEPRDQFARHNRPGERLTVERIEFLYNAPTGERENSHAGVYRVYVTERPPLTIDSRETVTVFNR